MFNNEFYPAPKEVIEKMVSPYMVGHSKRRYLRGGYTILEPSAGKGDICDYINDQNSNNNIYCCEIEPELKYILQEKGYKVIADDFLSLKTDHFFDLILMNPPFSNGDEHLLRAWEILEEGEIVCLLNAGCINNPYSKKRQLLQKIIEDHGEVEMLGDAFRFAERKTNVEVALVRLKKQASFKRLSFKFSFDSDGEGTPLDENTFADKLALNDTIGNMIKQYENLKGWYVEFLKVVEAFNFYGQGLTDGSNPVFKIAKKSLQESNNGSYNAFCDQMKQELWGLVLSKTRVEKYMTENVQKNFSSFVKCTGAMEFTSENVEALVQMVFENRGNIMEEAAVNVFDIFTKYHEKNRCHVEGWKTNSKWKVNKKIILPHWVKWGEYLTSYKLKEWGDTFSTDYRYMCRYNDIDKVMCYLTGTPYDSFRSIYDSLENHFRGIGNIYPGYQLDNTCESEFFYIKFFKKGTVHLEFKDERLWKEFNLCACAGKNWLPESEMKAYRSRDNKKKGKALQVG